MNLPLPPHPDSAARSASAVAELLEVLWGRSGDASSGPVSPSQLRVLYILESNDGVNLRTVADALASRASSVSRLCDRLQAIGLIERVPSVSSRREVELRLTSRGQAYLRDLRDRREAELQAILAKMPTARRAALIDGLEAFRTAASARLLGDGGHVTDVRTA